MKLLFIFVLGCVAYVNAFPVNNAVSEDDKDHSADLAKIKEEIGNSMIQKIEEENVFHDPSTKLFEEGSGDAKENNILPLETEEEINNNKEENTIQKEKQPDPFDVALTKLMEKESSGVEENNPKEGLKNIMFQKKTNAFIKKTSPPT